MVDTQGKYSTSDIPTTSIGDVVDSMVNSVKSKRLNFERRNYDNNFFDDGFHYRFYSRLANKIVDVSDRATAYNPMRAIPKASRQIRGVANLLVAPDYVPIVYPEKVDKSKYPAPPPQMQQQQPAPQMGGQADPMQQGQQSDMQQQISQPMPQQPQAPTPYDLAMKQAKDRAHKAGRWLIKEWETQDLIEKIAFMVILAAKHGVSWMQVWPDAEEEVIKTQVYDFFDIYINGELTDPEDAPFIVKGVPQLISQIKANEAFDQDQLAKISPDNKFASSDIKQAYMATRFNQMQQVDSAATLILKEAYIKEYLNDENMAKIRMQDDAEKILKGKDKGDMVMRQVFVAGNIWLRDRYVNLPAYPFVDFRMEPGPIYQVPLIERFIPLNKSLDALVSRAERYSHMMVAGSWSVKTGEPVQPTNDAGGQVFKYNTTPPTQNQIASIPPFFFELMGLMGQLIEEQGVSTTLGKLPTGVKGHLAIESLKESEYANLIIASRRLQQTVKRVAEKMFDAADNHFVTPQTVYDMKDGEPEYFDVIGASALEGRKKLKVETPDDVIPLKKDYKVEIQVEKGVAYTEEGKKEAALQLSTFMVQMASAGLLSPDVVKEFVKNLLDTYHFGDTEDIMEALDDPTLGQQMSEEELTKIKIAVLEALKDAGEIGPEASNKRVMENKVGVAEALKESGLADKIMGNPQPNKVSESITYKDAPEDIKRQIEAQAGMTPSQMPDPAQQDLEAKSQDMQLDAQGQQQKLEAGAQAQEQSMSIKEQEHEMRMRHAEELQKFKQAQIVHDMALKEKMATQQPKGGKSDTNGKTKKS